jgi:hypothetical protein
MACAWESLEWPYHASIRPIYTVCLFHSPYKMGARHQMIIPMNIILIAIRIEPLFIRLSFRIKVYSPAKVLFSNENAKEIWKNQIKLLIL